MAARLAIKTGILAGSVYYSKTLGVWGTSHQTEKLYGDISNTVKPYINQATAKLPFEVPYLPASGEVCFLVKHYYNQSVKATIRFIYMLPCYAGQVFKKTKDAINSALEKSQPAA